MRHVLVFATVLLAALPVASQPLPEPRTVTVSGDAEILVIPDEAVLYLAVETRDADVRTATDANGASVEAVTAVARRYGVPAARIQTERIDLSPEYSSQSRGNGTYGQVLDGYRASRSINVTLRDLDVFDDLLRDLIAAGVNRVDGVEYRTTSLRTHRDAARDQAVDAAREKAEALAGRLGQSLGRPITIAETNAGSPYGRRAYSQSAVSQNVVDGVLVGDGIDTSAGQISVRARVSVVFELAD